MKPSEVKDNIEKYLADAYAVQAMADSPGWAILKRDIKQNLTNLSKVWLTLEPNSKEYVECRTLGRACLQMLEMVDHYSAERKKAEDLWLRMNFPENSIPLDMDIDTPLQQEDANEAV